MSTALALIDRARTEIESVKNDFESVSNLTVTFEREANFALQILSQSDYLTSIAMRDPQQLRTAVYNVALTGLSLNPTLKLAYLLPRKNRVCLEPSYMGLVKILTDAGSVVAVRSVLICEHDEYEVFEGTSPGIRHRINLTNRGEVIGAYAVGTLANGLQQFEIMSRADIDSIMRRSESVKAGKSSPWNTDFGEMARKTVIRRLVKYLPKTDLPESSVRALEVFDANNPIVMEETDAEQDPASEIFSGMTALPEQAGTVQADTAPTGDSVADDLLVEEWAMAIRDCSTAAELTRLHNECSALHEPLKEKVKAVIRSRKEELNFGYNPKDGFFARSVAKQAGQNETPHTAAVPPTAPPKTNGVMVF